MASNGCGLFGTLSKVWLSVFGRRPPFERCCDEHDLAYEQGGNESTRKWADKLLRDCLIAKGDKFTAWTCYILVRSFGWIAWKYE